MKVFLTLLTTLALTGFAQAKSATAQVDAQSSKITWKGSKKIGGSFHTGYVLVKSGTVMYENGQPQSADITIDLNTITNTDLTDAKYNAKLVGHLKSEDFFEVAKFPTAQLKVSKISKSGAKTYKLEGEMTIKGVSQPITLDAEVTGDDAKAQTVQSSFSFDRTKFGLRYGSENFFKNLGDKIINDKVDMTVSLVVKK